jgi:hypothetical protein
MLFVIAYFSFFVKWNCIYFNSIISNHYIFVVELDRRGHDNSTKLNEVEGELIRFEFVITFSTLCDLEVVLMRCGLFSTKTKVVASKTIVRKLQYPRGKQGSYPGGGKWGSLQEKKNVWVSRHSGPAGPSRPSGPYIAYNGPTFCTQMSQRDPFVFRFNIAPFPSRRKPSILPRRCRLSQ